ncbi:MAG: DUF6614 family protein [Pseudomonadota bacterium]
MNLYHCFIELKPDAKVLSFCQALEKWMDHLQAADVIGSWRLMRRKLSLASDCHGDLMLEIEFADLAHLDQAFRHVGTHSADVTELYEPVHSMIADLKSGIYRPFPDPDRAERVALI